MRQALAGTLSSPRRRRRLAWSGGALLVVGAAVAAGVIWPNTGHSVQLPQHEGVKAVFATPESVPFTGARGDAVLRVEQRFVDHAVFRHDVAAAYDLVTPSLRGSLTRERWAAGVIPVEPYPAAAVKEIRGRPLYSYDDRVSLEIRFLPKPGAAVAAQAFDLVLRRTLPTAAGGTAGPWLVSSWLPTGLIADPRAARAGGLDLASAQTGKGRIGAEWLLLPVALVGLALLGLAGLGARGWLRHRRAVAAYEAHRAGRP